MDHSEHLTDWQSQLPLNCQQVRSAVDLQSFLDLQAIQEFVKSKIPELNSGLPTNKLDQKLLEKSVQLSKQLEDLISNQELFAIDKLIAALDVSEMLFIELQKSKLLEKVLVLQVYILFIFIFAISISIQPVHRDAILVILITISTIATETLKYQEDTKLYTVKSARPEQVLNRTETEINPDKILEYYTYHLKHMGTIVYKNIRTKRKALESQTSQTQADIWLLKKFLADPLQIETLQSRVKPLKAQAEKYKNLGLQVEKIAAEFLEKLNTASKKFASSEKTRTILLQNGLDTPNDPHETPATLSLQNIFLEFVAKIDVLLQKEGETEINLAEQCFSDELIPLAIQFATNTSTANALTDTQTDTIVSEPTFSLATAK